MRISIKLLPTLALYCIISACSQNKQVSGHVERFDMTTEQSALNEQKLESNVIAQTQAYTLFNQRVSMLLDINAEVEELATGFMWTEGPLWLKSQNCLLFSDIPNNKVMRYCPGSGVTDTYLSDSGFSNGLALNLSNELVLMQSRSRRIALMDAPLSQAKPSYQVLISQYQGKKLNSPNDVSLSRNGDMYFTDPPYGLPKQLNDPNKELTFQGVYKLSKSGELTLLDSDLKYPNGISFIDNYTRLVVAVSDPENPSWYLYDVTEHGLLTNKRQFASALKHSFKHSTEGLPDGLKQHTSGAIFATGPGGIWVFSSSAELLAHISIKGPVANLAFDESQNYVYLTAKDRLLRIKVKQTMNRY